jgi:glycosyltransferase involved in cell wall biosynthesis
VAVALSVVVVAHDMERELPRTLRSLGPGYQRGVGAEGYELIVVDNGSPVPIDEASVVGAGVRSRLAPVDDAPGSPARAANMGLELAEGELIGLMIDGARIASPGLLAHALLASRLAERPVIATLGWHLGPDTHMESGETGYDQAAEDRLLAESSWEEDGYRLFAVSSLAGSSRRGWLGPLGESNALFMARPMWDELGGTDERFSLPGGGLVNHDLYRRACGLDRAQLVVLLGEGTFHQIHRGASTSRRVSRSEARAEYERLRGHPYSPPTNRPLYLGRMPATALSHLDYSVRWRIRREREA